MLAAALRRRCHRIHPGDLLLISLRCMGGGPRTFPGGLNKWQWKRLHEKKAREKQNRLLDHEKQIYQARIRSEIRSRLSPPAADRADGGANVTHEAMSSKEHLRVLADRFMKEGAEDLWNEDDGPVSSSPPRRQLRIKQPVDIRKSGADDRGSNFGDCKGSGDGGFRQYDSGDSEDDLDAGQGGFHDSEDRAMVGGRGAESIVGRKVVGIGNSSRYYNHVKSRNYSMYRSTDGRLGRNGGPITGDGFVNKLGNVTNGRTRGGGTAVGHVNGGKVSRKGRYFRNDSSSSDEESELEPGVEVEGLRKEGSQWPRLSASMEGDSVDEEERMTSRSMVLRRRGSSAALGNYDLKVRKRVPLNFVEEEHDLSQQVEMIRQELCKQRTMENESGNVKESIYTEKRFDQCDISPLTIKALTASGYVHMTTVQEAALSVCLEGKDAAVKAKTGTGKTAAFLLPAIETVLKTKDNINQRVPPICVLILCPVRELASQIAAEARALLKFHDDVGVQTLVGGTRFKDDQKRLESDLSQIIVATPGRLLDHVENKSSISSRLMGLKMLIVDEADRMLDLGFRKDIEKIVDCLPRQRQSLLFSATMPKEVRRVSQLVLKRDHVFIDTVGVGSLQTPVKIKQYFLVAPHESHFLVLCHYLKRHLSEVPDYKVMVFCTTGMVTSLVNLLLRDLKMNVRELHSQKPQLYRTRISDEFRGSKRLILVTSDVSTRGVNYPDVTLVIQVGIPSDRAQYIYRLGRTGREGKAGEGILLLAPWEEHFLDEVKDLPIEKLPEPSLDPEMKLKVDASLEKIDSSVKEGAYHAWLGYYNSIREIGRDKTTLVELANRFSESIGLKAPPPLFRKTAIKMGLKDIPGIRVRK
ncbi:hypothetical protein MLD38_015435 [Melastoma candidum]|uniref:Uncharacterized protein n=1 Tax=Melastoma candidum TaxID=119954 RepID=A0ACB9RPJ2_9MYRT|nr:hypothetical protein MLD38_015435 [Melastoma candidum]